MTGNCLLKTNNVITSNKYNYIIEKQTDITRKTKLKKDHEENY